MLPFLLRFFRKMCTFSKDAKCWDFASTHPKKALHNYLKIIAKIGRFQYKCYVMCNHRFRNTSVTPKMRAFLDRNVTVSCNPTLNLKNEVSFLTKITFQKRVFVFDDIFLPVWWEKVKSKTKTRFCFSFLSDRLDRPEELDIN